MNNHEQKTTGPSCFGVKTSPNKLKLGENVIIRKEARVEVEDDQAKRNYLHLKPGTLGAALGAGLFIK